VSQHFLPTAHHHPQQQLQSCALRLPAPLVQSNNHRHHHQEKPQQNVCDSFLGEKSTHMQRCRIEFIAISAPFSHQLKNFWELQTVHGAASRACAGAAQEQER